MGGYRTKLAVVAAVVVGVASLVPWLGMFVLGPLAALIVGGVAAYRTSSQAAADAAAVGIRAALVAGIGALLGTTIFIAIAGGVVGGVPAVQDFVRASEPNVDARIAYEWIQPLAAGLGVFVGLIVGAMNLVIATLAGLFGASIGAQRPTQRPSQA